MDYSLLHFDNRLEAYYSYQIRNKFASNLYFLHCPEVVHSLVRFETIKYLIFYTLVLLHFSQITIN